ncbi:N-acyl-D-amino-acid deacylase family protein [Sphingobium sp. EP60837]|uniref:N-acyl-D-amino-acid deacylase family protein n=1 Tax=Sphingobium sp. EP60837 TaxID=1855519 RepID=UPI0007DDDD39|nr:amidohydrolase family protein [Sphingobium sp. EP60837]ANI79644.1 N-acyl-D-amino-acid deacylase [Sphingobium sp. EP60837]
MTEQIFDLIITGGLVIDGTGLPRRRVDIGVKDGRVAAFGHLKGAASRRQIDASGMIVAPGIVDPHTHYDPQITFDPYATMSCFHGVTTVLAGNCGFSAAPVRSGDREFLTDIFASVEDMNPIALSGVPWGNFETFPEYLASLEGNLGVNFACYVGHSNVRRWVMGEGAYDRDATVEEVAAMQAVVDEAIKAGAAGLSSSAAPTHLDIKGRPVPSRRASREELLALCAFAGKARPGTICYLPASAIGGMTQEDYDLLLEMGAASGLPIIIQGIGGRSKVDVPTAGWEAASRFLDEATARGTPVYSLLMSRPFDRTVEIGPNNVHYKACFAFNELLNLPEDERRAALHDTLWRDRVRHAVENCNRDPAKGTTLPAPQWRDVYVVQVAEERNRSVEGKSIAALAEEWRVAPMDAMLDLALDEDLRTSFRWRTESPEWAAAVDVAQGHPNMIVGVSDGGAHLHKDDGADWSSYFLRSWVLDRRRWTLEEGIRQITQVPACMLGFADRGTLRVGGWADIMIFDPETIGPWRKEFIHDLPGGIGRWKALGTGIKATIVNGEPIVLNGELTGAMPGHVVAPGAALDPA